MNFHKTQQACYLLVPQLPPKSQEIGGGAPPSAKGVITSSSGADSLVTPAVHAAPAAESEAASLSEGDVLLSLVAGSMLCIHHAQPHAVDHDD